MGPVPVRMERFGSSFVEIRDTGVRSEAGGTPLRRCPDWPGGWGSPPFNKEDRLESPYFNNLLDFVSQDERYNREMHKAKMEFEGFAGPIYETDRSYDARINSFHNWYILDRPLESKRITPLQYYLEYNANSLPEDDLRHYSELVDNLHALFEVARHGREGIRVRDLLTGKKYDIGGAEQAQSLDKGVLFNSRIFRHEGACYFSNYFLLHPGAVAKEIRDRAKGLRKGHGDPKAFLFQLVLFQSRYDQYRQMEPRKIYRFDD